MKMKKFSTFFLAAAILTACLCGCAGEAPPPTATDAAVTPAEALAERFNAALALLESAESYAVRGSVISSAEVTTADGSGESATLSVPLDAAVADGAFTLRSEGGDLPHATYFDGEHYYVSVENLDLRYRSTENDYYDFPATAYFCPLNAEAVFSPEVAEVDGKTELRFRIPFGLYGSKALSAWLGDLIDETCASRDIQVVLTLAADGLPEALYLFFSTETDLSGDSIRQELVVDLTFSDFSAAGVTPPSDLTAYADRAEADPTGTEDFLEIPPEDLE